MTDTNKNPEETKNEDGVDGDHTLEENATTNEELLELLDTKRCIICEDIIINSCRIGCGHTFCRYCIDFARKNHSPHCPACGEKITEIHNCSEVDEEIDKLFLGLSVKKKLDRARKKADRKRFEDFNDFGTNQDQTDLNENFEPETFEENPSEENDPPYEFYPSEESNYDPEEESNEISPEAANSQPLIIHEHLTVHRVRVEYPAGELDHQPSNPQGNQHFQSHEEEDYYSHEHNYNENPYHHHSYDQSYDQSSHPHQPHYFYNAPLCHGHHPVTSSYDPYYHYPHHHHMPHHQPYDPHMQNHSHYCNHHHHHQPSYSSSYFPEETEQGDHFRHEDNRHAHGHTEHYNNSEVYSETENEYEEEYEGDNYREERSERSEIPEEHSHWGHFPEYIARTNAESAENENETEYESDNQSEIPEELRHPQSQAQGTQSQGQPPGQLEIQLSVNIQYVNEPRPISVVSNVSEAESESPEANGEGNDSEESASEEFVERWMNYFDEMFDPHNQNHYHPTGNIETDAIDNVVVQLMNATLHNNL